VKVVREMYGVMVAEQASSMKIIISGLFTQEAESFANNKPIDLVDGAQLEKLIVNVQTSAPNVNSTQTLSPINITESNTPCPRCGESLILRIAKKGKNAGGQFLGCSSFPKCRYTQNA